MNVAPLSAGYDFLRSARQRQGAPDRNDAPRFERLETQVWIWLAVVPTTVMLLLNLGEAIMGSGVPTSAGLIVASFVSPILVLWALIGGARVDRLRPRWAAFQVGLSAGTALVALVFLPKVVLLLPWMAQSPLAPVPGEHVPLAEAVSVALAVWGVLWICAVATFTIIDAVRGARANRGTGLGKSIVELALIGAALATITWWIPMRFPVG